MNRSTSFSIFITRSLRYGMVSIPLLLFISPVAAKKPWERDTANNQSPTFANTNTRDDDDAKRNRTNNAPPVRLMPQDNAPRTNQTFRGGNQGGQTFAPPARNNQPTAPAIAAPPPSVNRNLNDTNRVFRGGSDGGRTITAAPRTDPPRPAIAAPAPSVNRNLNDTSRVLRGGSDGGRTITAAPEPMRRDRRSPLRAFR